MCHVGRKSRRVDDIALVVSEVPLRQSVDDLGLGISTGIACSTITIRLILLADQAGI